MEGHVPVRGRKEGLVTRVGSFREVSFRPVSPPSASDSPPKSGETPAVGLREWEAVK